MKIKIKHEVGSIATQRDLLKAGKVYDVSEHRARKLVDRQQADFVDQAEAEIRPRRGRPPKDTNPQ